MTGSGHETPRVEAAGAVLWRGDGADLEVALVHRPRYDDWSLPKGKLDPGEHPLLAALREVEEETGHQAVPGRPLGAVRYAVAQGPKRVRYWAARAASGHFVPGAEVDELRWLPAPAARAALDANRDRAVLDRFLADPTPSVALAVVRHASAGDRGSWPGEDRLRPLDERGCRQAAMLAALLSAYRVGRAATATPLRCRQTLEPFAASSGTAVTVEECATSERYAADPAAAVDLAARLAGDRVPAVLCGQREVIPDLVARTCTRLGTPTRREDVGQIPRGSLVVLHVVDGERVAAREWLPVP